MVITTIWPCTVKRTITGLPRRMVKIILITLLLIDVPLFLANVVKFFAGGWLPVMLEP